MRSTYAHVQQCFNLNRLEGDGCGPHDSGSSPDSPCLNFDPSPAQQRTLLADPIPNASMVRAAGCCSCSFHWPMGRRSCAAAVAIAEASDFTSFCPAPSQPAQDQHSRRPWAQHAHISKEAGASQGCPASAITDWRAAAGAVGVSQPGLVMLKFLSYEETFPLENGQARGRVKVRCT